MKRRIVGVVMSFVFSFASVSCSVDQTPGTWVLLGSQGFDEMNDRGVIRLGPMEGSFSRLRFELAGPLDINWVQVVFEDGVKWAQNRASDIRPVSFARSFVIDLPEEGKVINRIEFRCILTDSIKGAASPLVRVYGWKTE